MGASNESRSRALEARYYASNCLKRTTALAVSAARRCPSCPPPAGCAATFLRFSATCEIAAVGSLFAHPSVTEREFEVGFLQQHRAGASDTLASSPQKLENQVIVHFTFGALLRGVAAVRSTVRIRISVSVSAATMANAAAEAVSCAPTAMAAPRGALEALGALQRATRGVPVAAVTEMQQRGVCARCVGRFLGVRLHEFYFASDEALQWAIARVQLHAGASAGTGGMDGDAIMAAATHLPTVCSCCLGILQEKGQASAILAGVLARCARGAAARQPACMHA